MIVVSWRSFSNFKKLFNTREHCKIIDVIPGRFLVENMRFQSIIVAKVAGVE